MDGPRDSHRLLLVYAVAFRVLLDFLFYRFMGFLRGKSWREAHRPHFHRRNAKRVTAVILRVRGLFIKIGQLMSILANFLPKDFRSELEKLQDQVTPSPFDQIKKRLEQELGEVQLSQFDFIDPNPLAAASLAQVHKGRLHNGLEIVVKVQHPDIRRRAKRDLKVLKRLLTVAGWFSGVNGLDRVHAQLKEMIAEELDFEQEARNIQEISHLLNHRNDVTTPQVISALSSKKVLTTSFEDGIRIADRDALLEAGLDPDLIARQLLDIYCEMVFTHGVYHADPHPGNLLVKENGALVLLDFGAISHLSENMRLGMIDFLKSLLRGDAPGMHEAMETMGFIARVRHSDASLRLVTYFQRRFLSIATLRSLKMEDIEADIQTKLDMMADFRNMGFSMHEVTKAFQVPREWVLLHRTLLLLLGLNTHLSPSLNPISVIRPHVERLVLGPDGWKGFITASLKNVTLEALDLFASGRRVLRKLDSIPVSGHNSSWTYSTSGHKAARTIVAGVFSAVAAGVTYHAWHSGHEPLWKITAILGGASALVTLFHFIPVKGKTI